EQGVGFRAVVVRSTSEVAVGVSALAVLPSRGECRPILVGTIGATDCSARDHFRLPPSFLTQAEHPRIRVTLQVLATWVRRQEWKTVHTTSSVRFVNSKNVSAKWSQENWSALL